MDIINNVQEYLNQSRTQIPFLWFIYNMVLTAVLTFFLKQAYVKYGNSLSNRKAFGNNFIIIAMTTMLIISVVKSSLALSLGLVGALSIIRFRTAVKEPEELSYLFIAISIGLGFGANQGNITIVSFIIILASLVLIKKLGRNNEDNNDLNLSIIVSKPKGPDIEQVIKSLKQYCLNVKLIRLDETKDILDVSFHVSFKNYRKLIDAKEDLIKMDKNIKISFLEKLKITLG